MNYFLDLKLIKTCPVFSAILKFGNKGNEIIFKYFCPKRNEVSRKKIQKKTL